MSIPKYWHPSYNDKNISTFQEQPFGELWEVFVLFLLGISWEVFVLAQFLSCTSFLLFNITSPQSPCKTWAPKLHRFVHADDNFFFLKKDQCNEKIFSKNKLLFFYGIHSSSNRLSKNWNVMFILYNHFSMFFFRVSIILDCIWSVTFLLTSLMWWENVREIRWCKSERESQTVISTSVDYVTFTN